MIIFDVSISLLYISLLYHYYILDKKEQNKSKEIKKESNVRSYISCAVDLLKMIIVPSLVWNRCVEINKYLI